MRKAFLTTVSAAALGAFAFGPAQAADMLSVGVGGYMQQWFGHANRDDKDAKGKSEDGGWAVHSDSEIHIKGSLESDMGLKYTVHVELEGDGANGQVDESFVRVSGDFGQIEFGARDHAMVRMHSGISDVGIGLTSGDTQAWIPGAYLETAGHAGTAGGGNDPKLNYITPRVSGLQLGVSYAPDDGSKRTDAPTGNDDATWGAGLNFQQEVGDMNVTFSLGHRSVDSAGSEVSYMSAMAPATGEDDNRLTVSGFKAHETTVKEYHAALGLMRAGKNKAIDTVAGGDALATLHSDAAAAQDAITDSMSSMTKGDEATYTNAGVGVSFGAFKFNVAYATSDGGAYTTAPANVAVTVAEVTAIVADTADTRFPSTASLTADGVYIDTANEGDFTDDGTDNSGPEAANNNDPSNDNPMWMGTKVVEDKSKNFDAWGVSVTYTDGPMAVSLGHMAHEEDAGGERTSTMLSASYSLAPGIAWKSSIFTVDDDTSSVTMKDGKASGDMENEGTGFVTGIALSF